MWLRKTKVPGAAPGGLVWQTLDDVVKVDDDLGLELLDIPGAGFAEAPAPAGQTRSPAAQPSDVPEPGVAEVSEAPTARRRTRKATDAEVAE